MSRIDEVSAELQQAVAQFNAAAEQCASTWSTPQGPGKWSPSQISEHLTLAVGESAKVAEGLPSKFPNFPRPLQWLIRSIFYNRVLRQGVFPNGKTVKALNPLVGAATPAEANVRLNEASSSFVRACRARAEKGTPLTSPVFGPTRPEDFVRFQAIHVQHHLRQMRTS